MSVNNCCTLIIVAFIYDVLCDIGGFHEEVIKMYSISNPPTVIVFYFPHDFSFSFTPVLLKAFPLQAWTGPQGSRRFRLLDF
jgi:hypothetical protein